MMKVKARARRKRVAQVATSKLMGAQDRVSSKAKALRLHSVIAFSATKKFLEKRSYARQTTEDVPRIQKERDRTKSEYEGYGPKMSMARIEASPQARIKDSERTDAMHRYDALKENYKVAVNREVRLYREATALAAQMLVGLQKQVA